MIDRLLIESKMFAFLIFVVASFLSFSACTENEYKAEEVIGKTPLQLIKLRGFDAEQHYAGTKDGYHIHLVRIVHPEASTMETLKRPVIFNHGLLESSTIWLINTRNVTPTTEHLGCFDEPPTSNKTVHTNAAMMLANFGYDVWLMSMRGTDWSLIHDKYKPNNLKFWDYSLDDFALHDVPAVVQYVRRVTRAKKVGYVGHSQATFSVFSLLATLPHYGAIIEPVVAVAPVAYFDNITSVMRILFLSMLNETRDMNSRFPKDAKGIRKSISKQCAKKEAVLICQIIDMLIGGKGKAFASGFYSHLPYFTSFKVMRHFGQLIKNKRWARYDYGKEKNTLLYGSAHNPPYLAKRISSKSICLISTKSDSLSPPADVNRFRSELAVQPYRDIFIKQDFDHFDLLLHEDSADLVNRPMLKIFEEFEYATGVCSEDYRIKQKKLQEEAKLHEEVKMQEELRMHGEIKQHEFEPAEREDGQVGLNGHLMDFSV